MQTIKVKIIGTRPLLMHSDIYADPLNPRTKAHKALTAKKKKTDEDHEAIAQSEWRGGMYFDEELGSIERLSWAPSLESLPPATIDDSMLMPGM